MIKDIMLDAFWDTLLVIPFLLLAFYLIDIIQHRFGVQAKDKLYHLRRLGPVYGAVLGSLPQCGFSIIASSLFLKRIITPGTLIAVYIATSDEAIPILLANPKMFSTVFLLIALKIGIGILAGVTTDLVWTRHTLIYANKQSEHASPHYGQSCIEEGKRPFKEVFKHGWKHTKQIAIFIFVATVLLNVMFQAKQASVITGVFKANPLFQPLVTGLFGLIPNCATSVLITQAYVLKIISFGGLFTGLSSNAGLGLLVLLKETKAKTEVFLIVAILLMFSIGSGVVMNILK